MSSGALPPAGLITIVRALPTFSRKARPLAENFKALYDSKLIDRRHIDAYKAFCGFPSDQSVPLSYWYLVAQRAQLTLMMDSRFSYPIPGMVHVANFMHEHQPIDIALPIQVEITANQEPSGDSGWLFVTFDVRIIQSGIQRVVCRSRYLGKRGRKRTVAPDGSKENFVDSGADSLMLGNWTLEANTGRRYARISGDYNPIHLWPWSARLLGFKRPIAHGMFLVSKAQMMLEQSIGKPIAELNADFLKPAMLPGRLRIERKFDSYRILSDATVCVTGTYSLKTT